MKLTSLVIATTVAGILGLLTMQGASAGQVQQVRLKAATTTPVIEATTGTATFVASGLPQGTAYLEWFKNQNTWVRVAKLAKKGTKGSASTGNLPAGINKFRVIAKGAKSSVMVVRVYQTYSGSLDIINFGTTTFGGTNVPFEKGMVVVDEKYGCDFVDVGMAFAFPLPLWPPHFQADVQVGSSQRKTPVVRFGITGSDPSFAEMKIPVSDDFSITWETTDWAYFPPEYAAKGMYIGWQAHCLSKPLWWRAPLSPYGSGWAG